MAQKKTLHKCDHHSLSEPLQLSECPVVVGQGTLTQLFDSEFILGPRKAKLAAESTGGYNDFTKSWVIQYGVYYVLLTFKSQQIKMK